MNQCYRTSDSNFFLCRTNEILQKVATQPHHCLVKWIFILLGSYLMPGPLDLDIRDISFKLCYITRVSQSFSRIYDVFGHTEVEQWFCLHKGGHIIFYS